MRTEEPTLATKDGSTLQPVGLCGVPFRVLQEEADSELARKEQAADLDQDSGIESSGEEEKQTQLWVEKFKPR